MACKASGPFKQCFTPNTDPKPCTFRTAAKPSPSSTPALFLEDPEEQCFSEVAEGVRMELLSVDDGNLIQRLRLSKKLMGKRRNTVPLILPFPAPPESEDEVFASHSELNVNSEELPTRHHSGECIEEQCPEITRDDSLHSSGAHVHVSFSDMRLVQQLGSGGSGTVYLAKLLTCTDSKGGRMLAAKVMEKEEIQSSNREARAQTEREILERLDHPFLPKLYGLAETDGFLCLLMELCTGGDLYSLQQRQLEKRFDESAVRFYAAEVVAAIEYLHVNGIVYRDLKPENLLIQSDGHLILTDFDLSVKSSASVQIESGAKTSAPSFCWKSRSRKVDLGKCQLVAQPGVRSMSLVGTHEYVAPEVVSGQGHGSAVDWWALGVLVYELLYGFTPFQGSTGKDIFSNVLHQPLKFPEYPWVSSLTKRFVSALLIKDPAKRLGSTMGAAAIKSHSFFSRLNWALLRSARPPHIPPLFTAPSFSDTSDFSDF